MGFFRDLIRGLFRGFIRSLLVVFVWEFVGSVYWSVLRV